MICLEKSSYTMSEIQEMKTEYLRFRNSKDICTSVVDHFVLLVCLGVLGYEYRDGEWVETDGLDALDVWTGGGGYFVSV